MSKKKRNEQTNQTLARNELSPAVFSTSFPIAYVIDDVENTFPIQLGEIFERIIYNPIDLIQALESYGEICCGIWRIWGFDVDKGCPDAIGELFDRAYHARLEGIRGD